MSNSSGGSEGVRPLHIFDAAVEAMKWLGEQPDTIFVGQGLVYGGTFLSKTDRGVPLSKRIELPVAESFQMQFSVGLALAGYHVISEYPRMNFLNLAFGDMANIVSQAEKIGMGRLPLIIRTASGPHRKMYPGHQHVGDYSESYGYAFHPGIEVTRIVHADEAFDTYRWAYNHKGPVIVVEDGDRYDDPV